MGVDEEKGRVDSVSEVVCHLSRILSFGEWAPWMMGLAKKKGQTRVPSSTASLPLDNECPFYLHHPSMLAREIASFHTISYLAAFHCFGGGINLILWIY